MNITAEYQRNVSSMVQNEVVTRLNETISMLQELYTDGGVLEQNESSVEELSNIAGQESFIQPALDHAHQNPLSEFVDWYESMRGGAFYVDDEEISDVLDDEEEAREYCDYHNLDSEHTETLEYWAVSDWLASKLLEKGENIVEMLDFNVWGRTCSGQAISLDCVVTEIYNELHDIKEGG